MLVLTFQVDRVVYAVPVAQVIEVVPRVELRPIPHAPASLLGLLRYRGAALPVVDVGLLLGRSACADRLDTRIIIVRAGAGAGAGGGRLGLAAEGVHDLVNVATDEVALRPPRLPDAPYLGVVYETDSGLLQLIDPGEIAVAATVAAAPEPRGVIES